MADLRNPEQELGQALEEAELNASKVRKKKIGAEAGLAEFDQGRAEGSRKWNTNRRASRTVDRAQLRRKMRGADKLFFFQRRVEETEGPG